MDLGEFDEPGSILLGAAEPFRAVGFDRPCAVQLRQHLSERT